MGTIWNLFNESSCHQNFVCLRSIANTYTSFSSFLTKTKAISISASGGQDFHILSANSSCAEDPFGGLVRGRSSTIVSQPLHFVDEPQPTKIRIVKVTRPMLSGANDISTKTIVGSIVPCFFWHKTKPNLQFFNLR
jgi:hypothetical protein